MVMGKRTQPRGFGRRRLAALVALAVALCLVPFAWPAVAGAAATSVVGAAPAAPSAPLPVPADGTAYLGTYYNPNATPKQGRLDLQGEMSALGGPSSPFGPTGQPLSIVVVHESWTSPLDQTGVYSSQLEQLWAAGRVPLIEWACGDTDGNVSRGSRASDAIVNAFASQLAKAAGPVLLDWFPDAESPAANPACVGTTGATGYTNAFRHIRTLFQRDGATNVSFVWSSDPADAATASSYMPRGSIDWIAAQPVAPIVPAAAPDTMFQNEFGAWYAQFSTKGPPLMISSLPVSGGRSQDAFIQSTQTALPMYPRIRALVLFDAANQTYPAHNPTITDDSVLGAFSGDRRFRVSRQTTTTTVAASDNPVPVGRVVKLWASAGTDALGGTMTFYDNNSPMEGCSSVPVLGAGDCTTSSLGPGDHQITATYSGDVSHSPNTSASYDLWVSKALGSPGPPSIPPAGQAYLGAWAADRSQLQPGSSALANELENVHALNPGLGRGLSIVHVFQQWQHPVPDYQLRQVMAEGAIPMIDWRCGDQDDSVANGTDDQLIQTYARQLAALGSPVFLRWYWEPNLGGANNGGAASCQSAANPGGLTGPDGYVAAWRHIHDVFAAAGATNVAFVWSMSSVAAYQDLERYFPGSAFVDWVAEDGYIRQSPATTGPAAIFGSWYSQFASFGLPMMISETGVVSGSPGNQAAYFQQLQTFLAQSPRIRAVAYFDSQTSQFDYTLSPDDGLPAFQAMSRSGMFLPPRQPSAFDQVTVSPSGGAHEDEWVTIQASLGSSDGEGSLAFYAGGATKPLPGCEQVAISAVASCGTNALPLGVDTVTVAYSGDAEGAPASSDVLQVTVLPGPSPTRPNLPRIPSNGHAYLGAWVQPSGSTVADEINSITDPRAGVAETGGRPLSIVSLYLPWEAPATLGTKALQDELSSVSATGAIPLITWTCDPAHDVNVITSGADDQLITDFAHDLAALGTPMFLRPSLQPTNNGGSANGCLGSAGTPEFQLAYQHIHDVIRAAGATNVAFVWSVPATGRLDALQSYFPGFDYIDWVGINGYPQASTPGGGVAPATLGGGVAPAAVTKTVFGPVYSDLTSGGWSAKPLMITETGVPRGEQALYLQQLAADMDGGQFPSLKAIVYMDGPDRRSTSTSSVTPSSTSPSSDFSLDSAGLSALQSLASGPLFDTPRSTTSVALSSSDSAVHKGKTVHLSATVSSGGEPTDGGGGLTFAVDGTPIKGCAGLTATSLTCSATNTPVGQHVYTASYGGDTAYAPATSPAVVASAVNYPTPVPSTRVTTTTIAEGTVDFGPFGPSAPDPVRGVRPASYDGFAGIPTIAMVMPITTPAGTRQYSVLGNGSQAQTSGSSGPSLENGFGLIPSALSRPLSQVPLGNWIVLIAFALGFCCASYMAGTWFQDQRRIHRSRS